MRLVERALRGIYGTGHELSLCDKKMGLSDKKMGLSDNLFFCHDSTRPLIQRAFSKMETNVSLFSKMTRDSQLEHFGNMRPLRGTPYKNLCIMV